MLLLQRCGGGELLCCGEKAEDGIALKRRWKSGCQLLIQEETRQPVAFCSVVPTYLVVIPFFFLIAEDREEGSLKRLEYQIRESVWEIVFNMCQLSAF